MNEGRRLRDRSALVVYGSETGNAQDIAEELGRLVTRLHFTATVLELDSVSIHKLLTTSIVLFVVSTTGQGEFPANSRAFWKSIRSARLRVGCLRDLRFVSFGLGDSSYPKFNWAHKKLHSRIVQLGAQALCQRGEGDEQHPEGIDGSFLPWCSILRQSLLEWYPLPEGLIEVAQDVFLQPKWELEVVPDETSNGTLCLNASSTDLGELTRCNRVPKSQPEYPPNDLIPIPNALLATLVENERVTPESHWQDVRRLVFRTKQSVPYDAGDIITIFPKNFDSEVNQLIDIMEWNSIADRPLQFVPSLGEADTSDYPAHPILYSLPGSKFTLRNILLNYMDINAIPRRSFFSAITHFTEDETQRERLKEFTNPEFIDEFYDYTSRPRRSILEVLQEFHTVKIPWKWIANIIPLIRGRQFSIASGGSLKRFDSGESRIELLVAIVKYRTVIKKIRQGLCTKYLAALLPGIEINILLCKGGIKIAANSPILMVGPGTGVAPLRSMLLDRSQSIIDQPGPKMQHLLFFGGRNRSADFFYEKDWETLREHMNLEVYTAFSRDQAVKVYVQHELGVHSKLVYDVLQNGVLIICGSSGKMPQAVREAIIGVFEKEAVINRSEAEIRLVEMERSGRYQQETW